MLTGAKKSRTKVFASVYRPTVLSILLSLLSPSLAYANGMAALIYVPIVLQLAILLSGIIAVFCKSGIWRLASFSNERAPLKAWFFVMIPELIFMTILTYACILFLQREFEIGLTNYLSYASVDVAVLYYQKTILEHNFYWPLIPKLIVFTVVLSFINAIPNLRLLHKHSQNNTRLDNRRRGFLFACLLGIIAPMIFSFVIVVLVVVTEKGEAGEVGRASRRAEDVKNTLLREAAKAGYPRLVEKLLNKGAAVNAGSEYYRSTALHEAVEVQGNLRTVKLLIEKGANVNGKTVYGFSPLMIASASVTPDARIIQLLIDKGADVNAQTSVGASALMIASSRNKGIWAKYGVQGTEIEDILLRNGADLNLRDKRGRTALMYAVEADNLELVKVLLNQGADVNAQDKDGKSPYMLTSNDQIEKLLIEHGARTFP